MKKVLTYCFSSSFGEVLEFALITGLFTIAALALIQTVVCYWLIFTVKPTPVTF